MGKQQPPEYYNGIKYNRPDIYERYRIIYDNAATLLPATDKCDKIIDLGCGVGYFAMTVQKLGYDDYLGVDFSDAMIKLARARCPQMEFIKCDLFSDFMMDVFEQETMYVLLEVLEHVKKDRELLQKLPRGSTVIFSLPSYDATSHVRHFRHENQVVARYRDIISFRTIKALPWKGSKKVFLFDGARR
jgi:predicted RNA methylase